MLRLAKKIIVRLLKMVYRLALPVVKTNERMVLFISFHGRGFSDNPKAIFEAMVQDERFKDYTFVWALKQKRPIEHARVIRYNGPLYFWCLLRAKFWVFNCKMPLYLQKKADQAYLQTWHGTPLKRLAHDIVRVEGQTFYRSKMSFEQMTHTYDVDVARYNWMIAPNPFSYEVFQTSFRIDEKRLLKSGYPRNDALFKQVDSLALKKKYGLPLDKKIILYAPTWRDNSFTDRGYTFELKVDFHLWQRQLKEEYVVIFKPHYLISSLPDMDVPGFVYSVDAKADILDLYLVSDLLVTDYSSVFFDYALLKKPMYFYMFDRQDYSDVLRGFYFDVDEVLPGPIVEDELALLEAIQAQRFDWEKWQVFYDRFGAWDDGHASERVVDVLWDWQQKS